MNTVLVTGASGYLGWFVAGELARRGHDVVGTSRDGEGFPAGVTGRVLDLRDGGAAAAELMRGLAPRGVIHCAAMSNPDACAQSPEEARAINQVSTGVLAGAAADAGARMVYLSTDLVFDGLGAPYSEASATSPTGLYMQTKFAAEAQVLAASPEFLVVRVALLYGLAGGRQGKFTDWMAGQLAAGTPVNLWRDQYRTPAEVSDAAVLLCDLLDSDARGVLHLGGPERISRLDLGRSLAKALNLDTSLCTSASVRDDPRFASRPLDVSLDASRLREVLGRDALGVEAGCALSAARGASRS